MYFRAACALLTLFILLGVETACLATQASRRLTVVETEVRQSVTFASPLPPVGGGPVLAKGVGGVEFGGATGGVDTREGVGQHLVGRQGRVRLSVGVGGDTEIGVDVQGGHSARSAPDSPWELSRRPDFGEPRGAVGRLSASVRHDAAVSERVAVGVVFGVDLLPVHLDRLTRWERTTQDLLRRSWACR